MSVNLKLFWAVKHIPSTVLNGNEKNLLMTLISCANIDNLSWHSRSALAEMCSISISSIKRCLAQLSDKNFITIKNPIDFHTGETNIYSLNIEKIMTYSKLSTTPPLPRFTQNPVSTESDQARFTQNPPRFTQNLDLGSHRPPKYNNIDNNKDVRGVRSAHPPISDFVPTDQNKVKCHELELDLQDQLNRFKNRFKGKGSNLEFEFNEWLKGSFEHSKKNAKEKSQITSTVKEWGEGHPGWEALHAGVGNVKRIQ